MLQTSLSAANSSIASISACTPFFSTTLFLPLSVIAANISAVSAMRACTAECTAKECTTSSTTSAAPRRFSGFSSSR